jgi:hypothetical protein
LDTCPELKILIDDKLIVGFRTDAEIKKTEPAGLPVYHSLIYALFLNVYNL